MKIAVVGGGPSGLFTAAMVKKRRPEWSVTVIEQNAADNTFGFGVVLADTGLQRLRDGDADIVDRLVDRMVFRDRQMQIVGHTPFEVRRPRTGGAIARLDLLAVLQDAATAAGVDVRFGTRINHPDELANHGLGDADVVVGADGINSVVRTAFAEGFGTTRSYLGNHFAWYGTDRAFDCPHLVFRKHGPGGFVAHYYPYTDHASTFVAECDHRAWVGCGMDRMTEDERTAFFREIFADVLEGHTLLSNNTTYRQFPVIRNRTWNVGRYVLIGDAHTSAHFSIGSGTRIAMEDSVDLATALAAPGDADVATRIANFVEKRGPQKAKLIGASERSYTWYERVGEWLDAYTPAEFIYAFMTRTGRVDDARLAKDFPELFAKIGSHADAVERATQALAAGKAA